jgi:hypothetical protein
MLVTLSILVITSIILKISWWNKLDEAAKIEVEYVPPEAGVAGETDLSLSGAKQ